MKPERGTRAVRPSLLVWPTALFVPVILLNLGCPIDGPERSESRASDSPIGPPGPSPAPGFKVTHRVGESWDRADDRIEIYDRRRFFWFQIEDPQGQPVASIPKINVKTPVGFAEPKIYEVQADPAPGRFFVRIRFYEAGVGYKLELEMSQSGQKKPPHTIDLVEVKPAVRYNSNLALHFEPKPGLGKPFIPALIKIRAVNSTTGRAVAVPATPSVKVINPCGWGPSGSFAPDPHESGLYTYEIPKEEVIDVTGNYTVKVFPQTDAATFVEYTYETR